ncbi:PulJ/GspJ family protein [Rubinisphaera brasiliensis]|uniref:Prepilin-type N-terminal cleavage/methylation domain-containing protein n=1 Tax=Rubinisphaera brasiliensis (strain ATCC 49424 / DSM 5305 / JCM 21570 / IAM 15109 / NBRC 103401 / IFAM 1448) TaxID=756272 RepID=F0SQ03_RUBBR|nr:prepilin-type N-terminal cleavage/methylation domain-containing protein [Rubinisphaera brasiliensis]ADY60153.1 hypothetical protein Plabr_2553 [Rubinisphaera brasiliensis DSM 5305]
MRIRQNNTTRSAAAAHHSSSAPGRLSRSGDLTPDCFSRSGGFTPDRFNRSGGFTLTEMLVAVGLLLIIMTIFAQIFQLAVTAMTRQKGMANNDSQARTAFSVIDADLKRMSFRSMRDGGGIVPLVPNLLYDGNLTAPEQQGYFYYSENDPDNDTDDVLQFTVDASLTGQYPGARRYAGQSELPFYGRGLLLDSDPSRRDQPDWDDGTQGDNVSVSRWAEVAYFLRHGTLYRRVVLIRDTDDGTPQNMQPFDDGDMKNLAQPGYVSSGGEPIDMMRTYSRNFYTDFDFSAHYAVSPYDDDLTAPSGDFVANFHGSLSNEVTNNWPLGIPHYRFGFRPGNVATSGLPREFVTDGTDSAFIGRYTHEETSASNFQYPHTMSGGVFNRDDFDISQLQLTGKLDRFNGGSRRGADVLLYNVHSFDVEVWDWSANSGLGGFVDIDPTEAMDFGTRNTSNDPHAHEDTGWGFTTFGPTNGTTRMNSNVFDTWHPDFVGAGVAGFTTNPLPPKAPLKVHPNDGTAPTYTAKTVANRWSSGDAFTDGMYVFPSGSENPNYSNFIVWQAEVVNGTPSSWTLGTEPTDWSSSPIVDSIDLTAGTTVDDPTDYAGDGNADPDVIWHAVDNRRPVKAIRLTIRFLDPNSDQMRQVTMINSFNENDVQAEFN